MKVKDMMTTNLFYVNPDRRLDIINEVLGWHDIRHVLVVDEHKHLLGVMSQRDVLEAAISNQARFSKDEQRKLFEHISVSDVMKTKIITTTPGVDMSEAAQLLIENKIGCLPVLDGHKKVIGIITESDFVKLAIQNTKSET